MILNKAIRKHLQVFLSRISKFGRLAYIYDIVPIKRLRMDKGWGLHNWLFFMDV